MSTLPPDLYWLTLTAFATALFWLPYAAQLISQMGLIPALADAQHETPLDAAWARRAKRAHTNAVENLVVFAPLVIVIHLAGAANEFTAATSMVFFASRVLHYAVYTAGIPFIRTFLFAVGWACQLILVARLLGAI